MIESELLSFFLQAFIYRFTFTIFLRHQTSVQAVIVCHSTVMHLPLFSKMTWWEFGIMKTATWAWAGQPGRLCLSHMIGWGMGLLILALDVGFPSKNMAELNHIDFIRVSYYVICIVSLLSTTVT